MSSHEINKQWLSDWQEAFTEVEDPRVDRTKRHLLMDILTISLCAVISGCDSWEDVECYGNSKESWLSKFLELPNGIPSHDTFNRVFRSIDADVFQKCFLGWIKKSNLVKEDLISIDGKSLRGSNDFGESPLCMVSAWASNNGMVLGQVQTEEKSNEITAIPELLDLIDIEGAIVSIDAAGCQKNIAEKIKNKNGDYLLALKGNQGNFHAEMSKFLTNLEDEKVCGANIERYETHYEKGHGRIEKRKCLVSTDTHLFPEASKWMGLQSLVMIESEKFHHENSSRERRFYISSAKKSSEEFLRFVRGHWEVENKLHWVLDVCFNEDKSRVRKGNGPQNLATLRHIALNLIKKNKSKRVSIKGSRKKAGWDENYLLQLLGKLDA